LIGCVDYQFILRIYVMTYYIISVKKCNDIYWYRMSQIIESGYCTDYLSSTLVALFHNTLEGSSAILGVETNNPNTFYIQEMIRMKFIDSLQHNRMIDSRIINRLRVSMYNAGWLHQQNILTKASVEDFYTFLVSGLLNYNLEFIVVDINRNETSNRIVKYIELDDKLLSDGNISNGLISWLKNNFKNDVIYSFKELPPLIPIFINSTKPVDLMEAIRFGSIGDKLQKIFIWEINSIICLDKKGYYSIIRNKDDWYYYREGDIPSNKIICMDDPEIVNRIRMEIKLCFYWGNF